jgi:hypothetical protein
LQVAADMIKDYALQGIQHAMCHFNKK